MSTSSFSSQIMWHPCKPLMSLPCSVVTLHTGEKAPSAPWTLINLGDKIDGWIKLTNDRTLLDSHPPSIPKRQYMHIHKHTHTHTHTFPSGLVLTHLRLQSCWEIPVWLTGSHFSLEGESRLLSFSSASCTKFKIKRRQGPTGKCDFIIRTL